jgi:hypothetical protein
MVPTSLEILDLDPRYTFVSADIVLRNPPEDEEDEEEDDKEDEEDDDNGNDDGYSE